jgi:hypothetical protein
METLYFTLGIAFVVVAAVAVGAVWAMFKVAKLNSMLRDVEQQFGSTHRDITMVEHTIMNQINNKMRDLDERFNSLDRELDSKFTEASRTCDELHDIIDSRVDEIYRTIDSRVDKLAAKQEKQLLKG